VKRSGVLVISTGGDNQQVGSDRSSIRDYIMLMNDDYVARSHYGLAALVVESSMFFTKWECGAGHPRIDPHRG